MFEMFLLTLTISSAFAILKGGAPERFCAGVILTMVIIQYVGFSFVGRKFVDVDAVSFAVDLIGLIGLTAIALNANRIWPLWAAAMQLFSLASHFGRSTSAVVEPLVYSIMKSAPTFLVFLILMIGTTWHIRRVRRDGIDPGWTQSTRFPRWIPTMLQS